MKVRTCRRIALGVSAALICGISAAGAAPLSPGDGLAHDAVTAARSGNWARASQDLRAINDPLFATLVRWVALAHGPATASFSDYTDFIVSHPDWPALTLLRWRAEGAIGGVPDATLSQWFAQHPPVTPAGQLREADLWMVEGRTEPAVELIRHAWVIGNFTPFEEQTLLQRFHGALRPIDEEHRLDRLLWAGEFDAARRMLPRVSAGDDAVALARMALATGTPGADRLVAAVPAALQQDPGLLYERVRWAIRNEQYDDATALLESVKDPGHAEQWGRERQALARYALLAGKPAVAYRIAANNDLSDGPTFAELEFLAGWIALDTLHQPHAAYDHFVRLYGAVKMPISLARGAYWAGRAAEAMGSPEIARTWYSNAAQQPATYYGQLAAARLGVTARLADFTEPVLTPQEVAAFDRRELVRAVRLLARIGAVEYTPSFLHRLDQTETTPSGYALIARLAEEIDRPDLAVAAAKNASYAGVTLLQEGYPIPVEASGTRPLVLALTRQESAFDQGAVSRAGARGMMQLLPTTASGVARTLQLPFSVARLTSDVRYNMQLGGAYIDKLLNDFSGSYVLAIAAYNAGPARVRQWIGEFGDPRNKGVDTVDWVESIPMPETRNYVQRVMENLTVYRLRLDRQKVAFSQPTELPR